MALGRSSASAVALALAALLPLTTACASSPPSATDLVQGALAQRYFDQNRAIPSNEVESQLAALTNGLLTRVYALPPPTPSAVPLPIDVGLIKQTHGDAGVQEALLAAYIMHFHGVPDDVARQEIANLMGNGGEAPIPVPALEKK